jgi:anti-sigma regulatory factor (Ser/Thr protein kinase)
MENENHFYQEAKEIEPKFYEVRFDESGFGDKKLPIFNRIGGYGLPGLINEWWEKICAQQGINSNDKKLKNVDYFLLELGKNAFEHAEGGEIKVIFEPNKITIVVSDQGQGFENKNDVDYSSSSQMGHGLSQARKYADEFVIETHGKKYSKIKGKRNLMDVGVSDITTGSKITITKNFE